MSDVRPSDLRLAAAAGTDALAVAGTDTAAWAAPAGELDWSCRRVLDHIVDALCLYTGLLATRAERRVPFLRNGDADAAVGDLFLTVGTAAAVFAEVAAAAGPSVRAFHPAGFADAEGFVAMGCDEVLVHCATSPPAWVSRSARRRRCARRCWPVSSPGCRPATTHGRRCCGPTGGSTCRRGAAGSAPTGTGTARR